MLNSLISTGLIIVEWLQTEYPNLMGVMGMLRVVTRFEFYLGAVIVIYWSINKERGKQLVYLMLLTWVFVVFMKQLGRTPRPFWIESDLLLSQVPGFGLPSLEAAVTAVGFSFVGAWFQRRRWVIVLCAVWIALVGLSVVYLGEQFPHDVLAGYILATLLLIGYFWWANYMHPEFTNRILGQRFWSAIFLPFLIGLLYAIWVLYGPQTFFADPTVARYAAEAEREATLGMVIGLALLAGFGAGFIFERRDVRFVPDRKVGLVLFRIVVGFTISFGVWWGLGAAIESGLPDSTSVAFRNSLIFIQYLVTALMLSLYAPMVMCRIGLYEIEPLPPISGGMNRLKSPFKR